MENNKSAQPFKIDFLDHVAIRVKDMRISEAWYEQVLGLKKYKLPAWGEFPIFMMASKTGVALFPAKLDDPKINLDSNHVKIDHFAFQVSIINFEKAKLHYEAVGIPYTFQDHHYFQSIYTQDPDGHTVELTCLVVNENDFYKL